MKFPIGIQTFEKIRTEDYVYVDKTEFIFKLSRSSCPFFLSRPRRFGKSLLLSTFEAYFLGKKDLFKGLAIEKLEKDWTQYPVLSISFGKNSYPDYESLSQTINEILSDYEKQYNLTATSTDCAVRLDNLIKGIFKETGRQVVVLIDEYDKPVLDALYTPAEEKNRTELRKLYSPLKDSERYIRFLFLTGITKISHMNIFSGLNQLRDISLEKDFSAICGITEEELNQYFASEIEVLAREQEYTIEETKAKLAGLYDGYHFTHNVPGVYNPFCRLRCFAAKDFGSYWFESGTPSMLVKSLQKHPVELSTLVNGRQATEFQFKEYDPDSHNILPVIYQSGYLTIKGFEKETRMYTLDFPNKEVEEGFLQVLLKKFIKVPYDDVGLEINNLRNALKLADIEKVARIIKAAIADLPTIVKKDMCENYYESVVHLVFRLTGFVVLSELQNVCGRSDVVLKTNDSVFIFELKMDKGKDAEEVAQEALKQVDTKGYAEPFMAGAKKIYKIAFVFSSEGKGLVAWKDALADRS